MLVVTNLTTPVVVEAGYHDDWVLVVVCGWRLLFRILIPSVASCEWIVASCDGVVVLQGW